MTTDNVTSAGAAIAVERMLKAAAEYDRTKYVIAEHLEAVYQVRVFDGGRHGCYMQDRSPGNKGNELARTATYDEALVWVFANRKPVQSEV